MDTMKKSIMIWLAVIVSISLTITSCSDLEVQLKSEQGEEFFPITKEDYKSLIGGIYAEIKHEHFMNWFLNECSGDAMMLPANSGGGWFDSGRYRDLHMHTWGSEHQFIERVWDKLFFGINRCNYVLSRMGDYPDLEDKDQVIAEIRGLRAYFYFYLMDMFGGVPVYREYGEGVGRKSTRSEVYEFIESELLEIMPDLSNKNDISTYAKINKWAAYAILAKISINAQIYINENRGNKAVEYCDAIIKEAQDNGTFELTDDYMSIFRYDNGLHIKEFIFAIPFDGSTDVNNDYSFFTTRYWLTKQFQESWGIRKGSGPLRAQPVFYNLYTHDVNDERKNIWLIEEQYGLDNITPIIINTKYAKLDAATYGETDDDGFYTHPLAERDTAWHLTFSKDVVIPNTDTWQVRYDDELTKAEGYRSVKFYPNINLSVPDRRQDNDFPVFRYADILMMKAEAIALQGASATMGHSAVGLVNDVRRRSSAGEFSASEIDEAKEFLDERGREFAFEHWRRNDMIRLGAFESSYTYKTDNDINKRLFPIPDEALQVNPILEPQNPGYN